MGRSGLGLGWLGFLACLSCGGGGEQGQGGGLGAGGSGGQGATGGSGGMVVLMPCTTCTATEGCLFVTVTRASDVSNQPWTLWPDEADGRGTLVIAAYGGVGTARRTVPGADMTPASARYELNLGCVSVGSQTLGVFLDDNEDALPASISSSDYRDSCPMNRSLMVNAAANVTARVEVVLANSCD